MKLKKYISVVFSGLVMSLGLASADIGVGVTGTLAMIDASGSEKEPTSGSTETTSTSVDNRAVYGSVFIESISDNGFVVGVAYNPFSADVSGDVHERTETSEAGSGEGVTGSNTRKASAEVENYRTLYMEIPVSTMFVKLGLSQIDVNTTENALTNGGTYGDATLDGYNIGIGVRQDKGSYYYKASIDYVDFEDLSLSSTTNNSIAADLDVTEINFSIGKKY